MSSSQLLSVPPTLGSGTLNPMINILVESHGVGVKGKFPTDAEKTERKNNMYETRIYCVFKTRQTFFPGPKASF